MFFKAWEEISHQVSTLEWGVPFYNSSIGTGLITDTFELLKVTFLGGLSTEDEYISAASFGEAENEAVDKMLHSYGESCNINRDEILGLLKTTYKDGKYTYIMHVKR